MQIVAAVLSRSLEDFTTDMKKLSPFFTSFQIDVADGILVPGKTVAIEELAPQLALYPQATFDFHLMVKDYGKTINYLRGLASKIKIGTVLVHHKAGPDKGLFISQSDSFTIGLVINPEEQIKTLSTYYSFEIMRAVQIMSVEPGAQGQGFIKEVLNKIEQLRLLNYRNKIFLDGGVNNLTLPIILSQHYLPDVLAIGSYFTKAENLQLQVEGLKKILPQ